MDELNDIEDQVPPTFEATFAEPTFVEPEQRPVMELLYKMDYERAAHAIGEVERRKAVKYEVSLIGQDTKRWHEAGVFVLAQADRDVLQSAMDGTLPQRMLGDLRNRAQGPRDATAWKDRPDPVIYLNFIADRDGLGLSCDDMELFLDALEIGARLKNDLDGRFTKSGKTLAQGVDYFFNLRGGHGQWTTFLQTVDQESLETVVCSLVTHFRTRIIPATRQAGLKHVMLKAEVGWSMKGYMRFQDHANLAPSSPHALRLAQLVLWHLFPERHFHLHQVVLFEILAEEHAAIGESVASQLCASYTTYGGFNAEQAGLLVQDAEHASGRDWTEIRAYAVDHEHHYFRRMEANIASMKSLYNRELADATAALNDQRAGQRVNGPPPPRPT